MPDLRPLIAALDPGLARLLADCRDMVERALRSRALHSWPQQLGRLLLGQGPSGGQLPSHAGCGGDGPWNEPGPVHQVHQQHRVRPRARLGPNRNAHSWIATRDLSAVAIEVVFALPFDNRIQRDRGHPPTRWSAGGR
jgi:hypothetical protein